MESSAASDVYKRQIIMTPTLAAGLFALTLTMCAASAIGAIMKVMKLDPAMVFNR